MFPKIGVPQNGWFIMENPIRLKWMIWGYPYFWKRPYTPTSSFTSIFQPSQPIFRRPRPASSRWSKEASTRIGIVNHTGTLKTIPCRPQKMSNDCIRFRGVRQGCTLGPTWEIPINKPYSSWVFTGIFIPKNP